MPASGYRAFFTQATGNAPYPYEERLAREPVESRLIHVPTGCGKTAAVVLAWLWQRHTDPDRTPRRLVYCLPMRVLVEQTYAEAISWLDRLGVLAGVAEWEDRAEKRGLVKYDAKPEISELIAAGWAKQNGYDGRPIAVHLLMGGEGASGWDLYPERDAMLIGTQDMLLSRALNRGYAMSRYRWPMHFGLLNTDCLWVFDEIQLMGSGLATTAQLEAFRARLKDTGCHSFWMSATLQPDWLRTVDFDPAPLAPPVKLGDDDLATTEVGEIREAHKPLHTAKAHIRDTSGLAKEIVAAHKTTGGRTLVVVNTVGRARELHAAVRRELNAEHLSAELVLIHSRFRSPDRAEQVRRLHQEPGERGTIIISTQVVEAGVDVSARTLFTELAPWPSLVQRFGRCNRRGSENETARAILVDLPRDEKEQEKVRHPYELPDLMVSRELLRDCRDVSPASLEAVVFASDFPRKWVIRQKDFVELFDTTPDLAGNDIDIDRYVREIEESDVQVFWRTWPAEQPPPKKESRPRRDELCPVPIGEFREFVKGYERRRSAFRWDYLDRKWLGVNAGRICPGQVYLLRSEAGGYTPAEGWNVNVKDSVPVVPMKEPEQEPESNDDDRLSELDWQSIAEHTDCVCRELEIIVGALPSMPEFEALKLAARWHDLGKAHEVFQDAIKSQIDDGQQRPADRAGGDIAKAPKKWWKRYERKHFRHELASALAVLQRPHDGLAPLGDDDLNLTAYLIAAHHGKVRLSIRSLPGEKIPSEDRRFARGVWDGDVLPATDLGGGVTAHTVTLSVEPMELGLCEQPPFADQPSWAERMLALRDKPGPCRLAYLETMLRAADMRASKDVGPEERHSA